MASEHHRPSTKLTHAPPPPPPIKSSLSQTKHIIKNLHEINLLNEFYSFENNPINVQETVEILPQPVSCERIFYTYIDDHTNLRSREYIKFNEDLSIERLNVDFYSTTLFIFPKQRNEKFISEIRYIPEHITIRYKTKFELLSSSSTTEHYYQNIHDFYQIVNDIFYRI